MKKYNLINLYEDFIWESSWILEGFLFSIKMNTRPEYKPNCFSLSSEMTIIRLHDSWARFCRNLIIFSAGGNSITITGNKINRAPGIKKISDVIPLLISKYPNRKKEPFWANPKECIDAAQRLNIKNLSTISAAIGSVNSPILEIRALRNFIAHRSQQAAEEIRNQKIFIPAKKIEPIHLASRNVIGGTTIMEKWTINLKAIAHASIQ